MIITKYVVHAVKPRLSDEEKDPIEQDDLEGISPEHSEGWLPWDMEIGRAHV